jgi:opacity protein-like surface antigen
MSAGWTVKRRGFPVRLYLLGSVDAAFERSAVIDGSQVDVLGEARLVFPLNRVVRLYGLIGAGGRYQEQSLFRDGVELSTRGWAPVGVTGGGVQLRLHRNFSIGGRAAYSWTDGTRDPLYQLIGTPTDRWTFSGFVGVHF